MLELNESERRAFLLLSGLILLGAGARLSLGPGESRFVWEPAEVAKTGSTPRPTITEARSGVALELDREAAAQRPLSAGERLDPNRAAVEELRRLPGIGPTRARAIIEERARGGPFLSIRDLERVPGLGAATTARLSAHLRFDVATSGLPALTGSLRIDVNRAEIKKLEQIPRVGPVLASRIIHSREREGRFHTLEDLLRIPGIGAATLREIAPYVRFD